MSVTMKDKKTAVDPEVKKSLDQAAAVVRALTLDAVEKAQSGHPGMVLGCAELGALLYAELLQHDPSKPDWLNRDRFVLSAGHGSMFLYSLLHLAGYDVSIDDITQFRSLESKTPGHPEYGITPGVETTTGPLGQGLATAVGLAVAQKQQAESNKASEAFDNCTVVLAGDGCMMEGVVYESVSLAGTLALDNLIVFYDNNNITIDGGTTISFTEDVPARFRAAGWNVLHCSGYDYDGMTEAFYQARLNGKAPTLIVTDTVIGKDAPGHENTSSAHAGAMGKDDIAHIKSGAGLPVDKDFFVPEDVYSFFRERASISKEAREKWEDRNGDIITEYGKNALELSTADESVPVEVVKPGEMEASRTTFSRYLGEALKNNPRLIGGSADLTAPCLNGIKEFNVFSSENYTGNFIYYGIREHAMAAIANGITLYEGYRAFSSTFLSFSDYLRPALRLSALMELPVIHLLAYDSVYIGEDGPTHQPVEQLPAVRAIPNLAVIRPADAQEGVVCARMALKEEKVPVVCVTTRQKLECFSKADEFWEKNMEEKGAYIVREVVGSPEYTIVATGSEVSTVIKAVENLPDRDRIRIVSMPCREYFLKQDKAVRDSIVPGTSRVIVVEAAVEQGWSVLSDKKVEFIGVDGFGASAPGDIVADFKKIGVTGVTERLSSLLG